MRAIEEKDPLGIFVKDALIALVPWAIGIFLAGATSGALVTWVLMR
jgi:hypothetical protein